MFDDKWVFDDDERFHLINRYKDELGFGAPVKMCFCMQISILSFFISLLFRVSSSMQFFFRGMT
jgi:hypothetical protein